jgi:hypothetical protein
MANHASARTTQLYDRRRDELSLDEVERIVDLMAVSFAPIAVVRRTSRTEGAGPIAVIRRRYLILPIDNLWWPVSITV